MHTRCVALSWTSSGLRVVVDVFPTPHVGVPPSFHSNPPASVWPLTLCVDVRCLSPACLVAQAHVACIAAHPTLPEFAVGAAHASCPDSYSILQFQPPALLPTHITTCAEAPASIGYLSPRAGATGVVWLSSRNELHLVGGDAGAGAGAGAASAAAVEDAAVPAGDDTVTPFTAMFGASAAAPAVKKRRGGGDGSAGDPFSAVLAAPTASLPAALGMPKLTSVWMSALLASSSASTATATATAAAPTSAGTGKSSSAGASGQQRPRAGATAAASGAGSSAGGPGAGGSGAGAGAGAAAAVSGLPVVATVSWLPPAGVASLSDAAVGTDATPPLSFSATAAHFKALFGSS